MPSKCSVFFGRMFKHLAVCIAVLTLAVVFPTVGPAALAEGQEAPPGGPLYGSLQPGHHSSLHSGDWTEIEPFASRLERGGSSGSGLSLSTLGADQFYDDMENGVGAWTTTGAWAITTEWQPWSGTTTNHSWSDSPGGDYANIIDSTLAGPVVDLSKAAAGQTVSLMFNCLFDLQYYRDYLYVEFSNNGGTTWVPMDYLTGKSSVDGSYFYADIPVGMLTNQFRFRFRLFTDASGTADGVHIDDVSIYADSTTLLEEDNARIAYLGNWSTVTKTLAWGEPWKFKSTSTRGDLLQISFTGPGITWSGKMGTDLGIAAVSLDGGPVEEVDFYYPPEWGGDPAAYPMYMGGYYNLTDAPHTLTIVCSGRKNPRSTGYGVNFDEANVWGTVTQAPGAALYQQNNTHFKYMGPWATSVTSSASGGSFATVDGPGASARITFKGTYLALNAKTAPWYGKAQVRLDGGAPKTLDLYSSTQKYKQRIYSTGLLENTSHTLSIYWTGTKNPAASGTRVSIDSLDIIGTLTAAPVAKPILWRYQETEPKITYLGSWSTGSTSSASGGSFRSTGVRGAAAIVKFSGTSVSLLAKKAPWYGKGTITLDGGAPVTVDFYNATQTYRQAVYSKTGLSAGTHTLTIRCDGAKRAASSGYSISLDALDITGYLVQAPKAKRIQQDHAACSYSSGWRTFPAAAASGGSYAATNDAAEMRVDFTGAYLALVARTTPWCGKAYVSLDGKPGVLVDLYSGTSIYGKKVYETGLLDNGTHTLVVRWSGSKYAASSGYTIDVDAFDIVTIP